MPPANLGRGPVGKAAVVGAKDRASGRVAARVVENTDRETLQGFVVEHIRPGSKVYTDDAAAYRGLPNHETVKHSVSEYVNGQAHTNGARIKGCVKERRRTFPLRVHQRLPG